MDEFDKLKEDVDNGRIDSGRLVDLVRAIQRQLQAAMQEVERIKKENEELKKQLGGSTTAKVDEPYSMKAEEKRQEARGKKKPKLKRKGRRGRFPNVDKVNLAERTERCYPEGIPENECYLSHVRPVWRLEDGRAVLVAYEIFRGPKSQYGKIPGVLGRSEFAMEIVIEIAHLVYVIGMSFDKACQVLNFFQKLRLKKSQVDALLHQLSRHWEKEFDVLCTLLANSAVVHADETGWSLNSVWAFISEKVRLVLFGVHKDGDTLKRILDPQTFSGIVISDDAAVYANFSEAQKCWAHLLRKAIKLTLEDPTTLEYRRFTDCLLEIYREACRLKNDQRFSDEGRAREVGTLEDKIVDLCLPMWAAELPPLEGHAKDYRLLVNEVMRLMVARQLFTFVTAKSVKQPNGEIKTVDGTNNEAERTLRDPAQARKTGRTNKTIVGARRQTILVSVLQSLRLYLSEFTLTSVIEEINKWWKAGQSCFTKLLKKRKIPQPNKSILDLVLPIPDE